MKTRLLMAALGMGLVAGCSVKKTEVVTTPVAYRDAQTASRPELLALVNERYAAVKSLSVPRFKIQLTGGTIDDGVLEKYRDAPGYLIAQSEDSIFVNILNPLTKTSLLTMASTGGQFQVWLPRRNQFVTGSTDVTADSKNPLYNVRPTHILQGILIEPLSVGDHVTHYEDRDASSKYYVVMVTRDGELKRRLWIERSRLQIVRQQYYRNSALVSDINYVNVAEIDGRLVATELTIDRPQEQYSVRIELDTEELTINERRATADFIINQPRGAERVVVSNKPEVRQN